MLTWLVDPSQPLPDTRLALGSSSECDSRNSAAGSTMRGSGLHHSTGCPSEYQGKMPRR